MVRILKDFITERLFKRKEGSLFVDVFVKFAARGVVIGFEHLPHLNVGIEMFLKFLLVKETLETVKHF